MATVSFKADDDLKNTLAVLAGKKGINVSAYIKLTLTKGINEDLSALTENGLTVAEELRILKSDKTSKRYGPYKSVASLMRALEK